MTAIKARGETPFSEAGDGVVLCFRNSDMKLIEAVYGPEWFQTIINTFLPGAPSIQFVEDLVKYGAKLNRVPFEISEELLDEIPLQTLAEKVFDAACISMSGMPAQEFLADRFGAFEEAKAQGKVPLPPSPDTTSSTISGDAATGQASESKSSGKSRPSKR